MQWRFYLLSFRWLQHIFYPFGIASILCYMRQAFCMTHLQNTSLIYYFHFSLNAANQKLLCVFGKKKTPVKSLPLTNKKGDKVICFLFKGNKIKAHQTTVTGVPWLPSNHEKWGTNFQSSYFTAAFNKFVWLHIGHFFLISFEDLSFSGLDVYERVRMWVWCIIKVVDGGKNIL